MKTILDIGQQGAETLGNYKAPQAELLSPVLMQQLEAIKRFPKQAIEAETADGSKRRVEVRTLLLANRRVFDLVHSVAPFEPMIYARQAGRVVLGMLSPNYDEHGLVRQPSIKVLPLRKAMPLTSKLLPSAEMATMLAGAANAEGQGVGGHGGIVSQDYEHRMTLFGAISLGDDASVRSHKNHQVRNKSSVATGLSDGKLGTLYVPSTDTANFPGFGQPITYKPEAIAKTDSVFFPDSFLDSELAFGAHYDEASRIMLGAGMQVLYERHGQSVVGDQVKIMGKEF